MPASIDMNQSGTLNKTKGNKVTAEFHSNIPGKRKMVFERSSSHDYKDHYKENEAELHFEGEPFDGDTFCLEGFHRAVKRLERVWQPGESASDAAVPASVSSESGSPQFEKEIIFQTRNYKNGFLAVPVEVERIEIGDINASGSMGKIQKCKTLATSLQEEVCLSQEFDSLALAGRSKCKDVRPLFVNPEGSRDGDSTICFGTLGRFLELKHLELNITGCVGDSLLCSGTFLHASTYLEKLVLKLTWKYPSGRVFSWMRRDHPIKIEHVCRGCINKCLKELVYVGWLGLDAEVEILELLIESAGSTLERITIQLCHSHNDKDAIKLKTSWEKEDATARAMQLQQKLLSSNTKLLVG